MAGNELLTVRITPDEDRQLEPLVPDYLKGGRKAEQRVRWAIEQVVELYRQQNSNPATPPLPLP